MATRVRLASGFRCNSRVTGNPSFTRLGRVARYSGATHKRDKCFPDGPIQKLLQGKMESAREIW
jgi:hypothetical protein